MMKRQQVEGSHILPSLEIALDVTLTVPILQVPPRIWKGREEVCLFFICVGGLMHL
jgi:hypothetical protein